MEKTHGGNKCNGLALAPDLLGALLNLFSFVYDPDDFTSTIGLLKPLN